MANGYRSTLKSSDTEEHIDIWFYRPMGYAWALLFQKLGVAPNTVTIISIFLGVGAGILFGFDDLKLNAIGILLLIWANTYDSCDGQLARMTGKKSALGRILDGAAGDFWFISIYVSIALRLTPVWGVWIWLMAAVSGFLCHANQSRLADYYRNIHLYFLKGKEGSEVDDADKQVEKYKNLSWSNDFIQKLFQWFYVRYVKGQEKSTPKFQLLKHEIRRRYPQEMPEQLRADFRKGSLPLMKYTNILTFNWRSITLFVSIIIGMPWIYFTVEIVVFTAIYLYMHHKHEQLCVRILEKLDSYEK